MSRSRALALASIGIVALGAAVAVAALVTSSARTGVGPLPSAGLVLPADATFLVGIDVKRLTSSALYQKQAAARPEVFKELEDSTGLRLERDVELVVLAGSKTKRGVALAFGPFDESKLSRGIEARQGVSADKVAGTTLYAFAASASKSARGVAFLDKGMILFGDVAQVRETLEARGQSRTPLQSNATLLELLARVKPGSTFWMVGDQSLLANLPSTLSSPSGSSASLTLPALQSLIVTGDLEPLVSLHVTGGTADEAAAKNLADMVRGFVAIFALQASQKPELKELASALSVTQNATEVLVNLQIAPAVLERLGGKSAPGAAAPAQP
jgi:hypothetical protein